MKTVLVDEARLRSLFAALLSGAGAVMAAACAPADTSTFGSETGGVDSALSDSTQSDGAHDGGQVDAGLHDIGGDGALADTTTASDVVAPVDDGVEATSTDAEGSTLCPGGADADQVVIDGAAYVDAADETAATCDVFVRFTGCAPFVPANATCNFTLGQCAKICGFTTSTGCFVTPDNCVDGGVANTYEVVVNCTQCLGGRRPERYRERAPSREAGIVGDWFARLAEVECASIAAFRALRRELSEHGAPEDLRRRASRSARDEVRHTRSVTLLARRFGARPSLPKLPSAPVRALERVAIENVVEGCVRETFGALVAAWQAERASDSMVRTALAEIAADELEHAAFSWAVAAWAVRELDAASASRVAEARDRAVADLRAECASDPAPELVAVAGLPSARDASRLLDGLAASLWSAPLTVAA